MEAADGGKRYNSINNSDDPPKSTSRTSFWFNVLLYHLLAIVTLVLVGVWRGQYGGGFDWATEAKNYHIMSMSIAILVFYAYGLISYRLMHNTKKMTAKIVHTIVHVSALIAMIFGLNRVWGSVNLTSLHSWVAFATVILFVIQWLVGFVIFLLPGLSKGIKAWYKPNHVFWGVAIFACGCAAILTGAMEKASSNNAGSTEAYLANSFALGVLATGISVAYITYRAEFARQD
ncbi:hypothetical protein CAPTEDRAFT_176367 [Capitella teleta]|uniref:Cytochrome b561 domain-containing protein n=1 Tax=Capitella teleta TaxID=283909 RepID=R7VI84_CAPTE|nr:hypothetical protein CAPTEDRAFT_176367 [Capitella teleta]|eukprot:ELU15425.1 hypothetical protein CAPTEDRAFT_176367 [Capitella teleta]